MKRLNIFVLMQLLVLGVCAQTQLSGRVFDSEEGVAMQGSTVILTKEDTTGLVTGAISGMDGSWVLKNVKDGTYVLKVSFVGYHNFYHKVTVNHKEKPTMTFGTVLLVPSSVELKQTVVSAQMKEVEVKEDTIVFNAGAFKVAEGSVLEELIRKLPGAEVADDGTVKINGKTVKKIMVDGKEFFGNDKNMAMKNIPTEIVDKIKSYDRQSDLSRMTGIDDGEEETVIDIGIKKGMKKGWFGNADLAYGTRNRFADRLMVNRFADKLQASVIGSLNNTNDRTGGGGGRGGNNGNTTSGMAGANFAVDLDKFELGGNVRYNYRNSDVSTYRSVQNFVSSRSAFSNSRSVNKSKNHNGNGDFKFEWKPDSLTTVLFRPSFSLGKSESDNQNASGAFNSDPNRGEGNVLDHLDELPREILVNTSLSQSESNGDNYSVSGNLTANRRLPGRPWFGESNPSGFNGRNVSLRLSGSMSNNRNNSTTYSNTMYYQRGDSTDITYRYRVTPSNNRNITAGLTYSEPVMRNLYAQVNYSFNYQKRHNDGSTYDFGKIDSIGQVLWRDYGQFGLVPPDYFQFINSELSRKMDNENSIHNVQFTLRYITSLLNISAGLRIENQGQRMKYQYLGANIDTTRTFTRVSPTLNARFRFSKQHTLRITYRGNSQQPEMTDLFNLTDNSNPLNIREGNPDLKPSFNNNVSLDYNNFMQERSQTIFGRFSFSNTLNSITNQTEYNNETGGQRTKPVNINGNWNVNGNIGFNTPLGWEKLMLNTNTSASYNNNVGYIYQNRQTLNNYVHHLTLGERLSLTVRLENIDVRAYGNITWSKSTSTIVEASNQSTFNFSYGVSTTGNFPFGLGYSTDIGVNSRRGYSAEAMNTNEIIWNAQISYRFLKRKQATVSVQAYDILRQRSNISRAISAYSRTDSEVNSINSYVMFHFIYRLNMFGSRESRQALRNRNAEEPYARPDFGEEGGERPSRREGGEGGGRGGSFGGRGGFQGGGR